MTSHLSEPEIMEFGSGQHTKEYPKDKTHPEDDREAYHEGSKAHTHQKLDSKDQRSIKNRLEAEEKHPHETEDGKEVQALKEDPTLPARMHNNKPSRGAQVDKEIQDEEHELIARMDEAKADKKHDPHNTHHKHDHHIRK